MSVTVPDLESSAPSEPGRRARNRRQLIDAATALFLELGPERTTIDRICEQAGVVQRTFFNHFENRDALIDAIAAERVETMARVIRASPPSAGGVAGLLESLAEAIEGVASSAGPGYRRFLAYIIHVRGLSATLRGDPLHGAFLDYIRRGRVVGDNPAAETVLADLAASSIMTAIANWTRDPSYDLRDNVRAYAAYLTRHDGGTHRTGFA